MTEEEKNTETREKHYGRVAKGHKPTALMNKTKKRVIERIVYRTVYRTVYHTAYRTVNSTVKLCL